MTLYRSPYYQIDWPFGLGEEAQNRFQRKRLWQPAWISNRNGFSSFYLQVILMLPTKVGVIWPFGSGEEAKNRFLRW